MDEMRNGHELMDVVFKDEEVQTSNPGTQEKGCCLSQNLFSVFSET